jgi:hypothetical protein
MSLLRLDRRVISSWRECTTVAAYQAMTHDHWPGNTCIPALFRKVWTLL